jgi:histidinol-phosphate phosphatase family protein
VAVERAVLVAGGRGTRIRSLSGDLIPKALVPVAGEPIVFRQLRLLARYGVTQLLVLAGHLADELETRLTPYARSLGFEATYLVEDRPLGTAGGLAAAGPALSGGDFLVLYADIAADMDLSRLVALHRDRRAVATIVAHPNDHPQDSDLLDCDASGRVRRILGRRNRPAGWYRNMVPAAIYCCNPSLLDYIDAGVPQDFVQDVFPRILARGGLLVAYDTPEYLRDMGTPERYALVERDILSGRIDRMHWESRRPAVFLDRDGVLIPEPGGHGVVDLDQVELLPGAADAVRRINDAAALAVVVTNQPQVAKGFITEAQLETIHGKMETLLGREGAKLDRIFYCPHHPDRGHAGEVAALKIECRCRKPKPGMILEALERLPIALEGSCLVGDSWRDVGAGRASGVVMYGVRTGVGCRARAGGDRPDLVFSDVLEAVTFAREGWPAADDLAENIARHAVSRRRPYVVGVCGRARSGKSTFAHAVARALAARGVRSVHLRLDDWILPPAVRPQGASSIERCRVGLYRGLLESLLVGDTLSIAAYDPGRDDAGPEVRYRLEDEGVVLVDGLYACHRSLRERLDLAVMLVADDALLRERFRELYRWKGVDPDTIDALHASRQAEEWPSVDDQRNLVDRRIVVERKGREG